MDRRGKAGPGKIEPVRPLGEGPGLFAGLAGGPGRSVRAFLGPRHDVAALARATALEEHQHGIRITTVMHDPGPAPLRPDPAG